MRRRLRLAVAGLLAFSFCVAAAPTRARADDHGATASLPLRFSKHALSRMDERGVSPQQVRDTIQNGEAFKYYRGGRWELGYYDADQQLFIATAHGLVITVITHASRHYVDNLKKKRP